MAPAASENPGSKWKISTWGLIGGILIGLFWLALALGARYAVSFLENAAKTSGNHFTVSSGVLSFISGSYYLMLAVSLVIVKILHRAIREPFTIRGPIKIVLGSLTGIFYYLILGGGNVGASVDITNPATGSFAVTVTLLITLLLLELSAAMTIVQGFLEYREGKLVERARFESKIQPQVAPTTVIPAQATVPEQTVRRNEIPLTSLSLPRNRKIGQG